MAIKKVRGLKIGDVFNCKKLNTTFFNDFNDIDFVVTSFPNRKTVKGKEVNGIKTVNLNIKNIESEFFK